MTMEAYEEEKEDILNNSLTNLQWLQHINMNLSEGLSLPRKTVASSSFNVPTTIPDHKEERQRGVDYAHNSLVKPPYSYATLICMAIRATSKHKITLSAIYNWIMRNFAYYRNADPSWQNSIRHNLSLNKCFLKVPRDKDEPGKGGFWMINPEYEDYFKNGVFKRRKPDTKSKKNTKSPYARGLYRSNMFSTANGKQPGCSKSSPSNSTASSTTRSTPISTPRSTPINTPINTPHSTPPRLDFFEEAQQNQLMFSHSSPIRPMQQSHQHCPPVRKICTKALVNQNNTNLSLNNNLNLNNNNNANNNANNNNINNNNNNIVVDEQSWDLVLRDIQLNTGAFEQCVQQDDDFFNSDLNLGNDLLSGGGSTLSGDLSDLVRDIESLIDVPGLGQPDLVVKGEKIQASPRCQVDMLGYNPVQGVGSQNWGGIMDELNFGDYMDSPLSSLVG